VIEWQKIYERIVQVPVQMLKSQRSSIPLKKNEEELLLTLNNQK
jgi:hypothetical protein